DAPLSAADFERLLDLRDDVAKVLEPMRAAGEIGSAPDAETSLGSNADARTWLAPVVDEWRVLLISGDVVGADADGSQGIAASAAPTSKVKCVRCWQRRADVGSDPAHPEICARCVSNVEGPGETRRWF